MKIDFISRTLPCRVAAARTVLVILRFTVKEENRAKQYFKQNFFSDILQMAQDKVPNIRLKLCGILPRLKSVLSLPSGTKNWSTLISKKFETPTPRKQKKVIFTCYKKLPKQIFLIQDNATMIDRQTPIKIFKLVFASRILDHKPF